MSKYTAGPWLISETGPKYSINVGNGVASTRHVAMVSCFQQYEGDSKENIANAYLIAAAPELLEALQAAHRFLRKAGYDMTEINRILDKALGVAS